MGLTDRKEREKEEMRAKILAAANHLFLEQGYEKTSIRNIADAIEYSPSTIYLYFKDKNELFHALHLLAFEGLMKHFYKVAEVSDPLDKLIVLGEEYMAFGFENPELYELMFLLSAPLEEIACKQEIWGDGLLLIKVLEDIILECQKSGYFIDEDVKGLSLLMWGQVHGLVSIHIKNRTMMFEEDERLPRIHKSKDLFMKYIKLIAKK